MTEPISSLVPEVSVIIPTFDRPEKTRDGVLSVLAQPGVKFEVIVVDDGSSDPMSLERLGLTRLQEELGLIRIIQHNSNRGAAAARNTGMVVAKGDWIVFLDSDDRMLPDSLADRMDRAKQQAAELAGKPVVFGCAWLEPGGPGAPSSIRIPGPGARVADFCSGCWFCPGSAVLMHRSVLKGVLGNQDEALKRLEDLDWFISFGLAGGVLVVDPVARVFIDRASPPTPDDVRAAAGLILAKWHGQLPRPLMARLRAYLDLELAAAHRARGEKARAAWMFGRSWLRLPRLSVHFSPGWVGSNLVAQTPANERSVV